MLERFLFLPSKTAKEKIDHICKIAIGHFEKKSPLIIQTPNEKAAKYVYELLWNSSVESFLPHVISNSLCKEIIVITTSPVNSNRVDALLNLCTDISSAVEQFKIVYEIMDKTNKEKLELSKLRYRQYKRAGIKERA